MYLCVYIRTICSLQAVTHVLFMVLYSPTQPLHKCSLCSSPVILYSATSGLNSVSSDNLPEVKAECLRNRETKLLKSVSCLLYSICVLIVEYHILSYCRVRDTI